MFNWWTKFLEIFELKRIQIRTSRLNLSIPSFFVFFGREWHDLLDHLLDKLKKKHIISIKLITCKLTGCYIDSYRQFFVVDHQQINHHLDQKKKTIKTKILFKISSFRAILLKISRQKFAPVIKSSGFQGNNMRAPLPGKLWIFRLYFVVEKTVTAMSL